MTRINVGVSPRELSNQHLLAEHREIKRIPNAVKTGRARLDIPAPLKFKLNDGHVRFFYSRLGWLLRRYVELHTECVRRGFDVEDYSDAWSGCTLGEWSPTAEELAACRAIVLRRIHTKQRMQNASA